MKRLLISGLLSLILLPQPGRATDLYYINSGLVSYPPQIDAINFVNSGTFDFRTNPTVVPFDTSNTKNFTNSGAMIGAVGFQFDNAPSTGPRKLAANFRNRLSGRITALDTAGALSQINGIPVDTTLILPSFLRVSATNIYNEGLLTAGSGGLMRLAGTNVDLSRSGLQISPVPALGSFNGVNTNYFVPDAGIYDYFWGQTNQTMNSSQIIRSASLIVSPLNGIQYTPVTLPTRRSTLIGWSSLLLGWGTFTPTPWPPPT
jgi:hypothetical protein